MTTFIFVYSKDGKIKVLGLDQSKKEHKEFIREGWKHTQTLDVCTYIEYLYGLPKSVLVDEIKSLSE